MKKDLLSRYTWLIDTIRRYGRISRRDLNDEWSRCSLSEGEPEIPRRTFFNYRQAIEDIFSVTIECDRHTHEYFIADSRNSSISDWLLNASATNNVLQGATDIAERIMLEDVPSAREFLSDVIDAIRSERQIEFDYHPYTRSQPSRGVVIEPYFLRIHRQLWYVTGRNIADNKVKTYSLDRMRGLHKLPGKFIPPAGADPREFFRDAFGVMVTQAPVHSITLRVDARQAKYFRALPLHGSQSEMVTDKYSLFTYRMRLTPDLVKELLSFGPSVTVVSPPELRSMVTTSLRETLQNYTDQ